MKRRLGLWLSVAVATFASSATAFALPTMIRLGYSDCASCHVAPQGGGLLTDYGRLVDEAQSFRAADYGPSESELVRALNLYGRVRHDVRLTASASAGLHSTTGADAVAAQSTEELLFTRITYRNATYVTDTVRLSLSVGAELRRSPSDGQVAAERLFANQLLLAYRPLDNLEIAVGRDALPSGINLPNRALFVRREHRLGFHDYPLQFKAAYWNARTLLMPFAFVPSTEREAQNREYGGGLLSEIDIFGSQRSVVGTTLTAARGPTGQRAMIGGYARLGFGSTGLFVEHNASSANPASPARKLTQTSFLQGFYAPLEWLVFYAGGEHLAGPSVHRAAGSLSVGARWANFLSTALAGRYERDIEGESNAYTITLSVAAKTVD